jgi:transmembrane sensor
MSHRPSHRTPEEDRTIEVAAATWLSLRDAGLSPEQEVELSCWLEENPEHARVFTELSGMWTKLDGLAAARPSGAPDAGLLAPRRRSWFARHAPVVLATAAMIAVAGLAVWRALPVSPDDGQTLVQRAATEVGVQQTVSLPDGSIVRMNTDSAVEINYTAAERRVRLVRGEAHFAVAKNPQRPFIVTAGKVDVRAVGTAFNVRRRSEAVEVLVTEGKVRVDDTVKGESLLQPREKGETPLLNAGERAIIQPAVARPPVVASVAAPEMERTLAWQDRRLEFVASPLVEVVAEFNRYNRHKLVIADPRLGGQQFGGSFRADGFEALVRLLESDFGVEVERRENETILRLKR